MLSNFWRHCASLAVLSLGAVPLKAQAPGPISIPSNRPPAPATAPNATPLITTLSDDPFYSVFGVDHPPTGAVRGVDGSPGPRYWQQGADYSIQATLDTATKTIDGTVTIRYTNNSPTPLSHIWLQLEQNVFRLNQYGHGEAGCGIDVDRVMANGRPTTLDVRWGDVYGTMARLDLPEPVRGRGGRVTLTMHYHFVVPHSGLRMGRDSTEYAIAQWYPRVAVYDDTRGWNTEPYLGSGEFYLEYGDFDYAVTVPAGYTVWGTGLLQNPSEVLSAEERTRLAQATEDTGIVAVVTAQEAQERLSKAVPGTKTWHFRAHQVRDAVWVAAPDFRWDAAQCNVPGHAVLCQALYTHRAGADWVHAADQTRFSIRNYSAMLVPYPYPLATSVAALGGGGMEYPMITFDGYGGESAPPDDNFGVLDHELGHQWFPMLVGSNERRYAWMDEGFNTFINQFAIEKRRGAKGDTTAGHLLRQLQPLLTERNAVPLMTGGNHGGMEQAYDKTAAVLMVLRDDIVGPATFDRAFTTYVKRWAYKHPTPADFFRTIEDVTGRDLSWFWRGYFYSNDVMDLGIDTMFAEGYRIRQATGDSVTEYSTTIRVRRMTTIPFPITVRVKFADGTTKDIHRSVDGLPPSPVIELAVGSTSPPVGARLWPSDFFPDAQSWNNVWGDAPAADSLPKTQ